MKDSQARTNKSHIAPFPFLPSRSAVVRNSVRIIVPLFSFHILPKAPFLISI